MFLSERCPLPKPGEGGEVVGVVGGKTTLPDPTPNPALERTGHSAGVCGRHSSVCCGPPLTASVCARHAVMLGSESLLSRCAWSRRTREAPERHREVGSEGRVERRCGARDTNRIRGVVRSGRVGTRPQSPPSTVGAYLIHPVSMHSRYDS